MKIQELIAELQHIADEHGDLVVHAYDELGWMQPVGLMGWEIYDRASGAKRVTIEGGNG